MQVGADNFENLNIAVLGEEVNVPQVVIAIVADELVFAVQTAKDQLEFCDINAEASEVTAAWMNTIVIDTDIANLTGNVNTDFTQINNQLTAISSDIDNHISSIAGNTTNQFTQINGQLTAINTSLMNRLNTLDTDIDNHIIAADTDLNNHLATVDSDVQNTTTAVATDVNNHIAQVDSDVLSRATQIGTELSTLQTLDVRLEIEQVLSAGLTVGIFELPLTQGGYLETLRAIVSDAISKLQTGGQAVGTATKWLALGDTAYAAKQYKAAYQNYAAAYQTAAK